MQPEVLWPALIVQLQIAVFLVYTCIFGITITATFYMYMQIKIRKVKINLGHPA